MANEDGSFFHRVDGLAGLIIVGYSSRLPAEIVTELRLVRADAEKLANANDVLTLVAELDRLRHDNAELRLELEELSRMDGSE